MEITDVKYRHIQADTIGLLKGKRIYQFTIDFEGGLKAQLLSYGGIIKSLRIPDKKENYDNVVLSLPTLKDYVADYHMIGSLVGRYANRVRNGQFHLGKKKVELTINNGKHHLHGGNEGFGKKVWDVIRLEEKEDEVTISLGYLSNHNEELYPGNLNVVAEYIFTPDSFSIIYQAKCDQETIFNPTHHCYFNLGGDFSQDIYDHLLCINADYFVATDQELIPTGELSPVENTFFDFRCKVALGDQIKTIDDRIKQTRGFDHCYQLNDWDGRTLQSVAELRHPETGRHMEVWTTEPGIQLYTGNYLNEVKHPDGGYYQKHTALCLETQHFPDSPNHPNFPSTLLRPENSFYSKTTYRFNVINSSSHLSL